jgi:hypothetical protein
MVNGLDQEVDQAIRQLALAKMYEGREPGEPRRFRMSAQLIGGLDRDAPSIPFQLVGKHLVEQIGGQSDPADQLHLGQLGLDAGEARPPRIATHPKKERGGDSRPFVMPRFVTRSNREVRASSSPRPGGSGRSQRLRLRLKTQACEETQFLGRLSEPDLCSGSKDEQGRDDNSATTPRGSRCDTSLGRM